nr:sulfotransferase [Ardenticatena sp.]
MSPHTTTDSLWLVGSGRSGTTWFQRILVYLTKGAMCFEPLHPDHVTVPHLQPPIEHTNKRPYIRANQSAPTWAAFIDAINTGVLHSPWLDVGYEASRWVWIGHRLRHWFTFPQVRVVKSIRATLLIGWLKQHLHLPVVFLMRHPCAVLASQARHGWYMNAHQFLEDRFLVADYLEPYVEYIRNIHDEWAHRAAFWAIENFVASRLARQFDIPIVFYEHLVLYPDETLLSLFNHLGYQWDETRWARGRANLIKPSVQKTFNRWRETMPPDLMHLILEIVHTFGISFYDENDLPHIST